MLTQDKADNLTDMSFWFRYWMPYVFQQLEGKVYLPLNRDYKPLGIITRDHVDYNAFATSHGMRFARDPATFTDVWYSSTSPLVMYNDNPASRTDYFVRLERLFSRSVKSANIAGIKAIGRLAR